MAESDGANGQQALWGPETGPGALNYATNVRKKL